MKHVQIPNNEQQNCYRIVPALDSANAKSDAFGDNVQCHSANVSPLKNTGV